MSIEIAYEGAVSATNTTALSAIDTSFYNDGTLASVTATATVYYLNKTSIATVDGTEVVATLSGTGRWIKYRTPASGNNTEVQFNNNGAFGASAGFTFNSTVNALTSSYILATTGFSGSLTTLTDGTSYLIAGTNIQITTGSNGAVTIAAPTGNQGAQGYQGDTGPQGYQGDTGPQGFQGDTGPQGFQGDTGPQGFQGDTGPQGFQGDTGPQGFQGDTGPQGYQGDTGPQGCQGDTGPQGFQGDTGPQGFQGDTGPQGFQGDTGPQGFQGDTGPQGFQGITGVQGYQGITGDSFFTSTTVGSIFTTGSAAFIGGLAGIDSPFDIGERVNFFVSGSLTPTGADNSSIVFRGDTFISGAFGVSDYLQFKPVGPLRIPTNKVASYIYTSGSTNDMYFTQYDPDGGYTNTTRLRWIEAGLKTGLLHGGILSSTTGSTTFNITEGSALKLDFNASTTTDPYPTIKFISWPTQTAISLTYVTTAQITYVGIDENGAIIQRDVPFDDDDISNYIIIGRILHQSGNVTNGTITSPTTAYAYNQSTEYFTRAFGPLKISGHVFEPSGSNLTLKKAAGTSYVSGRNYTSDPSSPDLVLPSTDTAQLTSKIFREYVSGSTAVILNNGNAGYADIDPAQYWNGSALAAVGGGQYSIQRVYWFPNSVNRAFFVYYGTATYATLDIAEAHINSENFTEGNNTVDAAILLGYIIVRGNATDLTNTSQARIIQAGLFRSTAGGGGGGAVAITPGGLDTYVQFNDGGSTFGGDSSFTYNKTTNTLSVLNLSGSLTHLTDGTSYLIAGTNITITSGSNGSITIASPTGNQGPQGFQGDTGSQGFQGDTGPQGFQGDTGPQGFQGDTGPQGFQGDTGPQGFQGDTGPQGFQGDTGPQGFQGDTGPQGFQGDTGPQGFQGDIGPQGFQGDTGPQGFQGDTGPQGFQGDTGPQGFQGDTGPQGFQGDTGPQGFQGLLGAQGLQGADGTAGQTGTQGVAGLQGYQGNIGLQGYQGDIGNQGYQGTSGSTGNQGYQGEDGVQGFQGHQGQVGSQGYQGVIGTQGYQGDLGNQGSQGYQGQNGSQGYQGQSGFSSSYHKFKAKTGTISGDPGNGYVIWNNNTQTSASQVNISHLTTDNVDIDVFLALLSVGDTIVIQDQSDSNNYQTWEVSSAITLQTGYVEVPATYQSGGYSFSNDQAVIVAIANIGPVGPQGLQGFIGAQGFQGDTGPQGFQGDTGPQGFQGDTGPQGYQGNGFTTVANATDDRVLTSDGTSNAANAEANLTFTGSKLTVNGAVVHGDTAGITPIYADGQYSHAEGEVGVQAYGYASHAEGYGTTAWGRGSHAEGYTTVASGSWSHAEGESTLAAGIYSHAEGNHTVASGSWSLAAGTYTITSGSGQVAIGSYNTRNNTTSLFVIGAGTGDSNAQRRDLIRAEQGSAIGYDRVEITGSLTAGTSTTQATGLYSSAISSNAAAATGNYSHARGLSTVAQGTAATAIGYLTTATGGSSVAMGALTLASGEYSFTHGTRTTGSIDYAYAHGDQAIASGFASHAEGYLTTATNQYSHAEGQLSDATGQGAHAEGYNTTASGGRSHAEGDSTTASNTGAHAEGLSTTASGQYSHAEGGTTIASGSRSHAEGVNTLALGVGSHAEGQFTTGSVNYAHAQGLRTVASGTHSFAGGLWTISSGSGQTVFGQYNQRGNNFSLFVVGNGTGDDNSLRSDIFRIENSNVQITGSLIVSNSIAGSTTPLTNTDVILQSVLLYLANNT